ncbi:hypothetical protein ACIKT0_05815 [Hansschlegelia beijingensis]|uniref:hypothetical protein n=1 Tax=Hansschlegelia beijingensis TaxID=1133344 RepID=UPI00387EFADB
MAGRSPHPRRIPYEDRSGASGVVAYALGEDFIDLWFRDGGGYRYDATAPGPEHVAAMTRLAAAGEGLATYVNQHVRANYARRL